MKRGKEKEMEGLRGIAEGSRGEEEGTGLGKKEET